MKDNLQQWAKLKEEIWDLDLFPNSLQSLINHGACSVI